MEALFRFVSGVAAGIAALSHERTINPNMSVSLLEDILEAHRI